MTIDINQFWHLLTESRLVELSRIQTLIEEFDKVCASDSQIESTAKSASNWLRMQKLITSYQSKILLAGHSGPIRYGDYVVLDQITSTPSNARFRAQHLTTKFHVHLQFMEGSENSDLVTWKQVEALVEEVSSIDDPNLVGIFETAVLPDYRFVVSEAFNGKKLSDLVPPRGRMPWQDACSIMAHVAQGLSRLHNHGIIHNAISPRSIWVVSGGKAKLEVSVIRDTEFENPSDLTSECRLDYQAPEISLDSTNLSVQSDLYAFGCTLYRIIGGKTVFTGTDVAEKKEQHRLQAPDKLGKYEIPDQLQLLIDGLLSKDPSQRPSDIADIATQLSQFADKPNLLRNPETEYDAKTQAFKKHLKKNVADFGPASASQKQTVDSIGQIHTIEGSNSNSPTRSSARDVAAAIAAKRKRSKWKMPLAIAAALTLMSGVILAFAFKAYQTTLEVPAPPIDPVLDVVEPVKLPVAEVKPAINMNLMQILIEDDETSLWETPTTGPPLDLSYHPLTPRIIFAFRPAEILAQQEGRLLLRSLGPDLNQRIQAWRFKTGLELEAIQQLVVSLHPGEASTYNAFFSVKLVQPTPEEELIKLLNNPTAEEVGEGRMYATSGYAYYFIPENKELKNAGSKPSLETTGDQDSSDESKTTRDEQSTVISRFVFGESASVREVAEARGTHVLSGTLKKLVESSDADRHFTFLCLRPALFNEQGQSLMSGQLLNFNRQLDLFLQDEIRGGSISFHIDDGNYFEFVFDQTVDLESAELKTSLETRLRDFRDNISRFLATIPANEYWDKVRLRYDNMLADVYRNLRWDVEFKTLIGNCWLPPMAGHNLIAASELVTAFSSGSSNVIVSASKKTPASLTELLQTRRSLNVTTNPDLNVLLTGIRAEILDEYGSLPFDFEFRLVGTDLQKEGITQNQRPGDFQVNDKSLAEILTEIVVRCNPNKDINGARDPNCKLVWAVGPDPLDATKQAILITTRDGAAANNLVLPDNFQPQ